MEIKVERVYVTKSYDRNKIYTPVDITSQVVMPIVDVERLDTTLDTSSITLLNSEKTPIKPFTRIKITLTDENNNKQKIYRLVYTDNVEKLNYTSDEKYKHYVELIEPTKWLERFEVDNTTITNYLAWLYHEGEGFVVLESPINIVPGSNNMSTASTSLYLIYPTNPVKLAESYIGSQRIYDVYPLNSTQDINIQVNVQYQFTVNAIAFIPLYTKTVTASLQSFKVKKPSSNTFEDVSNPSAFTFDELGIYKFRQEYTSLWYSAIQGIFSSSITYEWETVCVQNVVADYTIQRYNMSKVCDLILSRITDDSSSLRQGIELPIFQIDANIRPILETRISPEFTFTQNTLFGVLSQIGNEIHAIPRLIPTPIEITQTDEENNTTTYIDDWSNWNTITFDFLGGSIPTQDGEFLGYESTQNGDNYATSFVSNIQNSFQTNNADYISLTEPHSDGFISTRTEDAYFEISNNSACIKTSRPIQRITKLEVWYASDKEPVDITEFVKEASDYSLLLDYPQNLTAITGYTTKSTAIYYTRGDNVIRGLDYLPPDPYWIAALSQYKTQAIKNIIRLKAQLPSAPSSTLKDLMFRIKYVPFYNLKAKQFKQYIDNESGNNELFYNQVNTQSVDIESLGENIKGALLRTANEEPTITATYTDFTNMIHAGQLDTNKYYAYEVNREITNKRIKTTTKFSKDWNKLNEYVAIKKNYREWEISERESIETTPCYNEFCIISDALDFDKSNTIPNATEKQRYIDILKEYGGFLSNNSIEQIYARINNSKMVPEEFVVGDYEELSADGDVYIYGFYPNDINDYAEGDVLYYEDEPYEINNFDEDLEQFGFPILESSKLYQALSNNETVTLYRGVKLTPIEWAVATCKNTIYDQEEKNTFLLPASCCSFGNSILVNFGAVDNYSIGTYSSDEEASNPGYALENYVRYTDKYGKVATMELKLGSGLAKTDGFASYNYAKATSKELYKFDPTKLYTKNVLLDYSKHDFTINKDSRQKLNFTIQLHFVSDTQNIWIGKALAQSMPFCGNTEENILKYVYFRRKPDKFCQEIDGADDANSLWKSITMPACSVDYDLKYIKYEPTTLPEDAVGFGLVDNQNRIVLYYNKEIKSGEQTEPLYFQLRRKI